MTDGYVAIQGVGGGGIASLASIILSDMVSLSERSKFQAIYARYDPSHLVFSKRPRPNHEHTGSIWAFAGGVGPVIGGAFAGRASWRWLFCKLVPL